MLAKREYPDQWSAIDALLGMGASVAIDEAYHDLINRGYVATGKTGAKFLLQRVGVHYEWHLVG
jgi:hypothetical protein